MRFLQVSDLHLDRPFTGITKASPAFEKAVMAENKRSFAEIIQLALDKKVQLVLFCGDTFHSPHLPLATQSFFIAGLNQLAEKNIQVVITFGNHDYYTKERFLLPLPENVHLFTKEEVEVKRFTFEDEIIEVAGFSYNHPTLPINMGEKFPKKGENFRIGIYHGEEKLKGVYAPFQKKQLASLNYDYWALGHIHVPEVLSFAPPIIYPGTPVGHTKKETQVKGVVLGEVMKGKEVKFSFLPVSQINYTSLTIRLGQKPKEFLNHITGELNQLSPQWHILSLTLTGENLDEEFTTSFLKGELAEFLKGELKKNYPKLYLQELKLLDHGKEKIYLPIEKELLVPYEKLYQEREVFQDFFPEFSAYKELRALLVDEEFKKDVLKDVFNTMNEDFSFKEEDKWNF